jgi:sporulation protein YlmC with PRC-barrel domain
MMRPKLTLLTATTTLALLTIPTAAEEAAGQRPEPPKAPSGLRILKVESDLPAVPSRFQVEIRRTPRVVRATDVNGIGVQNSRHETVATVEDMAVDVETGRLVLLILSHGSITSAAVPPGAFRNVGSKILRLDSDTEKLSAAPRFDFSNWKESTRTIHIMEAYRYFGQEPFFGSVELSSDPNSSSLPLLGEIERASKVIGTTVRNPANEKLGTVDNLIVDLERGQLVYLILGSGGSVGVGELLNAIPPQAFSYNSARDTLQLNATRDDLERNPGFNKSAWPDLGSAQYLRTVYRAYRIEPDCTSHAPAAPAPPQLTPLTQRGNAGNLEVTRRTR